MGVFFNGVNVNIFGYTGYLSNVWNNRFISVNMDVTPMFLTKVLLLIFFSNSQENVKRVQNWTQSKTVVETFAKALKMKAPSFPDEVYLAVSKDITFI